MVRAFKTSRSSASPESVRVSGVTVHITFSGVAEALYNLGLLYEYGIGVDKDYEKALGYYQQAADAGHEKAPATVEEMREKLNNSKD